MTMFRTTSSRRKLSAALAVLLSLSTAAFTVAAQDPAPNTGKKPAIPRTPDGKPDLQGNWSNETQTPLERLTNGGLTLTEEQARALEQRAEAVQEFRNRPTDPNAPAPPKGGERIELPGEKTFLERVAAAAGGAVGGYNNFWLDPGNNVIRIDGVPRSSIIIDPPNGRLPPLTAAAKQRLAERAARTRGYGPYDHPELSSLSDRCLTSFGSNAGPPMLPNYFYNNNYTIVQTADHVMIMTEMIHDARIIKLNAKQHVPAQVRLWFGDSIGHWEGDTLVVETTNIHPTQLAQSGGLSPYRGASDQLKVIERFTLTDPNTILYKFTVEDPDTFTAPYSGELPFNRIDEEIYEYACHEGNYALPGMLAGARLEEATAAEKKQ
jgi:hypothetical protein